MQGLLLLLVITSHMILCGTTIKKNSHKREKCLPSSQLQHETRDGATERIFILQILQLNSLPVQCHQPALKFLFVNSVWFTRNHAKKINFVNLNQSVFVYTFPNLLFQPFQSSTKSVTVCLNGFNVRQHYQAVQTTGHSSRSTPNPSKY